MSIRQADRRALVAAAPAPAAAAPASAAGRGAASPLDYGAIGNGVADDTAAINRCLAESPLVHFGGPDQQYVVTGTLVVQRVAGQALTGGGAVIRAGAAGLVLLRLARAGHAVSGVVFAGHPGGGGAGVHIEAAGSQIDRCSFVDIGGPGVSVRPGAHHATVVRCAFHRCGYRPDAAGVPYAVAVAGADHCAVLDNELVDVGGGVRFDAPAPAGISYLACRGNAITGGPGAVAQGIEVSRGRLGRVTNNRVTAFTGDGIACVDCSDTVIAGNTTEGGRDGVSIGGVAASGLHVVGNALRGAQRGVRVFSTGGNQGSVAGVIISGNAVSRPSDGGILVSAGDGTQLAGVLVVDNDIQVDGHGDYGIAVRGAETSRVAGNRIFRPRTEGIRLDGADMVQVTGNTLQDAGYGGQEPHDAIAVAGSRRVLVRDTTVYGNARHAVNLAGGTGMSVVGNRWRAIGMFGAKDRAVLTTLDDNAEFNLAQSTRIRIMPLGDSITDGMDRAVPGGYRTVLWQRLTADGHPVDFVGSRCNGPDELGDLEHEGHEGWRIGQISDRVVPWLQLTWPRVVLLHIGTNDIADPAASAGASERLAALVDRILGAAPGVHLFVAQIINRPVNQANEQRVRAYNATIPAMVASRRAAGRQVHLVDMFSALTAADLADGTHPNPEGYRKMASIWYDALRSVPASLARP